MRIIKITKINAISENIESNQLKKRPINRSDIGVEYTHPYVGGRYELYPISKEEHEQGISTSLIMEIIDDFTFKTLNSIYKIEEISNPHDK